MNYVTCECVLKKYMNTSEFLSNLASERKTGISRKSVRLFISIQTKIDAFRRIPIVKILKTCISRKMINTKIKTEIKITKNNYIIMDRLTTTRRPPFGFLTMNISQGIEFLPQSGLIMLPSESIQSTIFQKPYTLN